MYILYMCVYIIIYNYVCIYVYIIYIYIHIYELNYRFGMNCITDLRIGFTGGKGTLTKTRSLKE